jgi:hypothetical protein
MKLRTDLLEQVTDQDLLEEALATNHRFKPEPLFSKTGVGSLLSASTAERANEAERSTVLIQKLRQRASKTEKPAARKQSPSVKP